MEANQANVTHMEDHQADQTKELQKLWWINSHSEV